MVIGSYPDDNVIYGAVEVTTRTGDQDKAKYIIKTSGTNKLGVMQAKGLHRK